MTIAAYRVLRPGLDLAGGQEWAVEMGPVEAELRRELARRWLLWRDEVIEGGLRQPETVRATLAARQGDWERAPHSGHGGRPPVEVILAERAVTERRTGRPVV